MSILTIVAFALIATGLVWGAIIFVTSRAREQTSAVPAPAVPAEPWNSTTTWTAQAGEEFAALSEPARCDLIFAVADLNDEQSRSLLLHALDDPSETVALAAAHVLAQRGEEQAVRAYAQRHPDERAQRITQTLELLG